MYGKVKYVEFPKFDFYAQTTTKTDLTCSYAFKAQAPDDKSAVIRAILVSFDADSEGDLVHFHAQCRVVFEFTAVDVIPSEDDFISENYKAAYQAFCKKANEALAALGQSKFAFQEI